MNARIIRCTYTYRTDDVTLRDFYMVSSITMLLWMAMLTLVGATFVP